MWLHIWTSKSMLQQINHEILRRNSITRSQLGLNPQSSSAKSRELKLEHGLGVHRLVQWLTSGKGVSPRHWIPIHIPHVPVLTFTQGVGAKSQTHLSRTHNFDPGRCAQEHGGVDVLWKTMGSWNSGHKSACHTYRPGQEGWGQHVGPPFPGSHL